MLTKIVLFAKFAHRKNLARVCIKPMQLERTSLLDGGGVFNMDLILLVSYGRGFPISLKVLAGVMFTKASLFSYYVEYAMQIGAKRDFKKWSAQTLKRRFGTPYLLAYGGISGRRGMEDILMEERAQSGNSNPTSLLWSLAGAKRIHLRMLNPCYS
ncbi:hypothetical protein HAX54_028408 [Datura stramonium]|uniref:Uncharacterized protein n=1 Tax=Datura stramonium TaxID=4076 RepID=A0ABS8V445_DATST|nr:hypothetical protein [Datura stramonium]